MLSDVGSAAAAAAHTAYNSGIEHPVEVSIPTGTSSTQGSPAVTPYSSPLLNSDRVTTIPLDDDSDTSDYIVHSEPVSGGSDGRSSIVAEGDETESEPGILQGAQGSISSAMDKAGAKCSELSRVAKAIGFIALLVIAAVVLAAVGQWTAAAVVLTVAIISAIALYRMQIQVPEVTILRSLPQAKDLIHNQQLPIAQPVRRSIPPPVEE
jgi:hypothetical protein